MNTQVLNKKSKKDKSQLIDYDQPTIKSQPKESTPTKITIANISNLQKYLNELLEDTLVATITPCYQIELTDGSKYLLQINNI